MKEKVSRFFNKSKAWLSVLFDKADSWLGNPLIRKICFGLVLFLSFLLIYVLNINHPLFGDDWIYSIQFDRHTRIRNFSDIFDSLYEHYFIWGGRIIVHAIAETLLLLDFPVIKLLNSIAFVSLVATIYKTANRTHNHQSSLFIFIGLLLFFFQPAFGSTLLWVTGSANYLWGTLIIVTFLYPYTSYIFNSEKKDPILKAILFFLAGIIAGWTNENMAVALIFMLVLFLFYYKIKLNKIPRWAVLGTIGVVIGAAFMIAAPGNYARMDEVISSNYSHDSFLAIFLSRFYSALSGYYYYVLAPTFIYVIMVCLHGSYGKSNNKTRISFLSFTFFAGAIIATLAMSASPVFPGRAAFGIITLVILATAVLYANLDFSKLLIKRLNYSVLCFALLFFIAEYYRGYITLNDFNRKTQARTEEIIKGKQQGVKDFIFEERIEVPISRFIHYYEFPSDSTYWQNRIFSAYYGINSIMVKQ